MPFKEPRVAAQEEFTGSDLTLDLTSCRAGSGSALSEQKMFLGPTPDHRCPLTVVLDFSWSGRSSRVL